MFLNDWKVRFLNTAHGEERLRVILAAIAFFLLLCSYYVLRPVRDDMAVQTGSDKLQWLFSGTLLFTLMIVPVFGWVVRRVPHARIVPAVYGFLILNLIGFQAAFAGGVTTALAATFFIWLSVFNLFVVSLFWSRMSDLFSTEASHRVYGFIAAGGTAGALTGPALTALLAPRISTVALLSLATILLAAAGACIVLAGRAGRPSSENRPSRPVGGAILAGVPLTLSHPSLRGITALIVCYTAVSTVLYIELVELAGTQYADSGERKAFFAIIDLAVNALALTLQMLGTRRIVQRLGLRKALSIVPLMMLAGLAALGAWRTAIALATVQTLHRAGEYAINRPGREMIYTTVGAESRYKAKSFIDTAVYRASDAASAWLIAAVRGAGLDAVAVVGIPAALLWLVAGFKTGGRHDIQENIDRQA